MLHPRTLAATLALPLGLWAIACGGSGVGDPGGANDITALTDTVTIPDTLTTPDTLTDTTGSKDTDPLPTDSHPITDLGVEDSTSGDASPDGQGTEPHNLGAPCETGDDCYSGLCVEHMGDSVCTKACDEDCPPGWSCEQVIGAGGDPIFVCVSSFEHLCRPCLSSDDCTSETSEAACIDYDGQGAFCGAGCLADGDCPEGFVCQESVSTRGGSSSQCVDADGICECSTLATTLGLATACSVSNDLGSCEGIRTCSQDGLSECDAATPAEESCNGQDDDCDDEVDEVDCDDQNPCTYDLCEGEAGCNNTIIGGAPCDDDDPATGGDTCTSDGACVGEAITCPVDDCIQETAPNGTDCDIVYKPLAAFCDDGDATTQGDICDGAGACQGTPYTCELGVCEIASTPNGVGCDVEYWASGTACDDGDATTQGDLCDGSGGCQGTAYTCEPTQCEATSVPNGTDCSAVAKVAGSACDDLDIMTKFDACDGFGGCAGEPYTCEVGLCVDSSTHNGTDCNVTFTASGLGCDDGDVATKTDQCDGQGACVGTPYTCEPGPCEGTSTPNGQGCDVEHWALGYPCDDGLVSTSDDQCDGQGGCGGTAYVCEPTQCAVSSEPNGADCDLTYKLAGIACDDGAVDTKGDQCDGVGGCAGQPYTCEPTQCEATSLPNGTGCDVDYWAQGIACDDGDPATADDVCDGAGTCQGQGYTCAPGLCELIATPNGQDCDITYALEGAACDDGLPGTLGDQCDGAGGCEGTPYACTPDSCDVTSVPNGQDCDVTHQAVGTPCDDGDAATKDDQCDGGGACLGTPYGCAPAQCEATSEPDGAVCAVTYLDAATGCDDGDPGTEDDQCDGQGGCQGTPYTCEPTQCQATSTPDGTGCVITDAPAAVPCDDGDVATKADVCDGFGLCAGTPYVCTPAVCEAQSVPDGTGCVVTLSDAGVGCDDGDLTTQADQCDGLGGCAGTPYVCQPTQCQDSSIHNGDNCDVVDAALGTGCDDQDPATVGDSCDGQGACLGAAPVCGDGVTEGIEACDDHNAETETCVYGEEFCMVCDVTCALVAGAVVGYCGDGVAQTDEGEGCDDANALLLDGCSPDCALSCPPGSGVSDGACVPCVDSTASQGGAGPCVACPLGTEPQLSHSTCVDCPVGTYGMSEGVCVDCQPCPPGEVSAGCGGVEAGVCEPCPDGTFKEGTGSWDTPCVVCEACEPGFERVDCGGASVGACEPLSQGVDCAEIHDLDPAAPDGTYIIDPDGADGAAAFEVYCDMTTDGGGWTLVAVSSDDGQDTWTWNNRHYWDTDTTTFGDVEALSHDYKSWAHHSVSMSDVLFVHAPSGVWASYHRMGDGSETLADVMEAEASPECMEGLDGYPMTAGTVTATGSLCSTQLFLGAIESGGPGYPNCSHPSGHEIYGPVWDRRSPNGGCLQNISGSGLGPGLDPDVAASAAIEYTVSQGFGYSLDLNTGAAGTGENHMKVFVRRPICGNGVVEGDEVCEGTAGSGLGCDPETCEAKVPEGCTAHVNGDRVYLVCESIGSWAEAHAECESYGAELLGIEDAEEQNWLFSTANPNNLGFWSDGTDAASEGAWLTGAGEPVSYIPWCGPEPNGGVNENCLQQYWNGQNCANDSACENGHHTACEFTFTVCGDGVVEGDEVCDDGDTDDGDGCSADCVSEEGEACAGDGDCVLGLSCIGGHTAAIATFTFGDSEFDDVNHGSIALTSTEQTTRTYTIRNDYLALSPEFNAGAKAAVAATNLVIEINGDDGHGGEIVASNVGATVTLRQAVAGASGNTPITLAGGFAQTTSVDPPATFIGGSDELGTCYDGSEDDPCVDQDDCVDGLSCVGAGTSKAATLVAGSHTAGEANTRTLVLTDAKGLSVHFVIDNDTATSTATVIAFGDANEDPDQFAANIAAAVQAAHAAGTLGITATADSATVTLTLSAYVPGTATPEITGTALTDGVIVVSDTFAAGESLPGACEPMPEGYVYIPAGTFVMGSPESEPCRDADETQHPVTLTRPFLMKQTEVTQAQWQVVMGNTPSSFAGCDDCPVEGVSWWDTLAYANALSVAEGLTPCYTLTGCSGTPGDGGYGCDEVTLDTGSPYACEGYRLPTEAEWEYAARAGTQTSVWAGTITDCGGSDEVATGVGWCAANAGSETHPVAQKAANPWGLFDTVGNVSEWCWDWYDAYSGQVTDPSGPPPTGGSKVSRGYSWTDECGRIRAANRNFDVPSALGHTIGFRPVRTYYPDADGDGVSSFGDCDDTDPDWITDCCGNGVLDPGELCDDGNILDGDTCINDCAVSCGAVDLDGDNDQVNMHVMAPWQDFTAEVWAKPHASSASGIARLVDSDEAGHDYFLLHLKDGVPAVDLRDSNAASLHLDAADGASIVDGGWHHVAVVRQGDDVTLFVDGAIAATATTPYFEFAHVNALTAGFTNFGGANGNQRYDGLLTEVRVSQGARYTTAFTPQLTLGSDAATLGYWALDGDLEGQGSDSSTATLAGGADWVEDGPGCSAGELCGDGVQAGWEQCDDSNTDDGDGCSATCEDETPACEPVVYGHAGQGTNNGWTCDTVCSELGGVSVDWTGVDEQLAYCHTLTDPTEEIVTAPNNHSYPLYDRQNDKHMCKVNANGWKSTANWAGNGTPEYGDVVLCRCQVPTCPCTPGCAGLQCGVDGCGNDCGECAGGTSCVAGTCG